MQPFALRVGGTSSQEPVPPPLPPTLVLGAQVPTPGVTSFTWDEVPRGFDITPFTVIVCVLGGVETWNESLSPLAERLVRAIYSGIDRLVFVGDPTAAPPSWMPGRTVGSYLTPWLPRLVPEATVPAGVPVRWEPYFRHVRAAPGFIPGGVPPGLTTDDQQRAIHYHSGLARVDVVRDFEYEALVNNGHGDGLAFFARASFNRGATGAYTAEILWLPATPPQVQAMAIDEWLRHGHTVDGAPAPAWASEVSVAEAEEPAAALGSAERRLVEARSDIARLAAEVESARRFAALLWETGAPLEELVLRALERLGCSVAQPEARGKEDGRAVDPNGVCWTVEVKGREGGVKQDDVKAAHAHETEAFEIGAWEGRALLVVNAHRLMPPAGREVTLPGNAAPLAERWNVPILSTSQLLDALNALHLGTFDSSMFWKAVAEAKGLVDLPATGAT